MLDAGGQYLYCCIFVVDVQVMTAEGVMSARQARAAKVREQRRSGRIVLIRDGQLVAKRGREASLAVQASPRLAACRAQE
jgi:hypothetical protein